MITSLCTEYLGLDRGHAGEILTGTFQGSPEIFPSPDAAGISRRKPHTAVLAGIVAGSFYKVLPEQSEDPWYFFL